jgi:hypothetical protein
MALKFLNNGYFAGKVGIGTASPGAKLSIAAGASDANTEQIRFNRTNDEFRYNSIFSTISSSSSTAKISFGVHDSVTSTSQATVMSLLGNGNVGIGTTSPAGKLEIQGSNPTIVIDVEAANENGTLYFRDAFGGGVARIQTAGQDITFRTGTTGDDDMVIDGGNVGIGTTSPQAKLHINQSIANTAARAIIEAASWDATLKLKNSNGTWEIFNDYTGLGTTGALAFYNSGYRMVIDNTGNVGIGTTSPSEKLEVNGNINVGDTGGAATINFNASLYGALQLGGTSMLSVNTGVSIGSSYVTQAAPANGLIVEGNVGIGTTSPAVNLDILKTGGYGFPVTSGTTQTNGKIRIGSTGTVGILDIGSGSTSQGGWLQSTRSDDLSQGYNLLLNPNGGNVGIGTTSPVSFGTNNVGLTVNGSAGSHLTWQNNGTNVAFAYNVGNNFLIGSEQAGSATIFTSAGTQRMRIDGSGNVGIGTTNPGAKLEIEGSSEPGIRLRETGGSNYYDIKTDGSIAWFGDRANSMKNLVVTAGGGAEIRTNGDLVAFKVENIAPAGSLYIKGTTGNVGIGTTAPATLLHVTGSSGITIENTSTTNVQLNFKSNSVDTWRIGQNLVVTGGTALEFYDDVNNVDRMVITNTGNVGIGTTTPQSKLQVAGGIQMADDTDTASASKVGTMRYRTGTEYVDVTGTDLVTNGDFAKDTNWTKGTGVTIASGVGTWTNTANNIGLTQLITFTANAYYRCNVTVSNYSSGSFRFRYPGISSPRITANGTYSLIIQANQYQLTTTLFLQGETNGDANVNFSIGNVSVVEVTAEDASYADMCMQTGASTYEWVNIVRNTY